MLRNYKEDTQVATFYYNNHINQTLSSVLYNKVRFSESKIKLSIFDAINILNDIIDESDPDTSYPQIVHCIQTGEMCKELFDDDYMHLIGFIHDLGKIMQKLYNLPQYLVVGDTFPVGCRFDDKIVYHNYFTMNSDNNNPKYNTKLGIYEEHIGFDNVHFSTGHDEYMYQICKKNNCLIPEDGLYIIRYHSFYAFHQYQSYDYLANEYDNKMLPLLQKFQKCDLYSKLDKNINIKEYVAKRIEYYKVLIKKYFPNEILE